MNSEEILKLVAGVGDMLSKQFGVAADKLYPILMKQTQFHFGMDIMWLIISTLIIVTCFVVIYKSIKFIDSNKARSCDTEEMLLFASIGSGILIIVIGFVFFACLTEAMQIKYNPEWFLYTEYIKPLLKK